MDGGEWLSGQVLQVVNGSASPNGQDPLGHRSSQGIDAFADCGKHKPMKNNPIAAAVLVNPSI